MKYSTIAAMKLSAMAAKPSVAESKTNLSAAKFIRASDDELIGGKVIIASVDIR
jgi:hypothetical protein